MVPIRQTPEQIERENEVAHRLGVSWNVQIRRFGELDSIDFYAQRDQHLVSVIEIKCRNHTTDTYRTVFLSLRKWLALGMARQGLGVAALFAVAFTDEIRFIPWDDVDARHFEIRGRKDRNPPQANDIEPIIHVPVREMTKIEEKEN